MRSDRAEQDGKDDAQKKPQALEQEAEVVSGSGEDGVDRITLGAGNAVRTLFNRWCLPGETAAGEALLRLDLRDGYLNFHIKGQSVAKLSAGRNGRSIKPTSQVAEGREGQRRSSRAGLPSL